jgi:hypothetical protein
MTNEESCQVDRKAYSVPNDKQTMIGHTTNQTATYLVNSSRERRMVMWYCTEATVRPSTST